MGTRTVLRGGSVVTTAGVYAADVALTGDRISAIGDIAAHAGDTVVDVSGRLVMPGFIDAHSHADALTADSAVALALLRQGVTSVIAGQDGVSFAPGDGGFATSYFAAINGAHPTYRGGGVSAFLAAADQTSPLNVGYLVPAGTVRFEVCGRRSGPASEAERERMAALVAEGMHDGALGLSTGLDYVPGLYQDADEIAALAGPVAAAGGVYVTHMRGGYEANSAAGIAEISSIVAGVTQATGAALPVHISHFHADADIVLGLLDELSAAGLDATFDAYPYIRGCTLLGMPLLPPEVSSLPAADAAAYIANPAHRAALRAAGEARATQSASLGEDWPDMITLAHIAAPEFGWAHGLTLREAAERTGTSPIDCALDVLAASVMECTAVMAVQSPRPAIELARIFSHPAHIGGSDGIFIGHHPHPRAAGSFAAYLRMFVRDTGTWSWPDAAHHLSALPAQRFGLGERGTIALGAIADLIVVDPERVADTATYDMPTTLAVGIDDVFVAGTAALRDGALTGAMPGRGLRREPATRSRRDPLPLHPSV